MTTPAKSRRAAGIAEQTRACRGREAPSGAELSAGEPLQRVGLIELRSPLTLPASTYRNRVLPAGTPESCYAARHVFQVTALPTDAVNTLFIINGQGGRGRAESAKIKTFTLAHSITCACNLGKKFASLAGQVAGSHFARFSLHLRLIAATLHCRKHNLGGEYWFKRKCLKS
jgi:hypothetical protein